MNSIDAMATRFVGAVIRNDSQQQTYGDRLDCVPGPAPSNLLLSATCRHCPPPVRRGAGFFEVTA